MLASWHNRVMTTLQSVPQESFQRNKTHFLSLLSFLLGFLDAFFLFIISSYFVAVSGNENVGGFYLMAFVIVFGVLVHLGTIITRFGRVRVLYLLLSFLIGVAAMLASGSPSWFGAFLLIAFLVVNNVMWVVMDVLLESYSADHVSGRVRGLYLTIMNTGFLVAPWLATRTLDTWGYSGMFTVLTGGYALVLTLALIGLDRRNHFVARRLNLKKAWQSMRAKKNLLYIYHISFALEFFYSVMIIYTPLFLINSVGFDWGEMGQIFTLMLLPFVLFQYPLGMLADTRYGERELLFLGLFILAIPTALVGFLDTKSLVVWASVLFSTRVGAAIIEILRDSYFYKQVSAEDADIISFFRTARPIANILSALIAVVFLLFFPIQGLFFVVVGVALSAALSAFLLQDSRSDRERAFEGVGKG